MSKGKNTTKSKRAGLVFPVGRIRRRMKTAMNGKRISDGAAVAMASALEYLSAEMLEMGGEVSQSKKRVRITHHHLSLGVMLDQDFSDLLRGVTISQSDKKHIESLDMHKLLRNKKPTYKYRYREPRPRPPPGTILIAY